MSPWNRLWKVIVQGESEFRDLDPVLEERCWIRGAEVVTRTNYRLLDQVVKAKGRTQ